MNDLNIRIAKAKGYGNPCVNIPQWDKDIVLAMELMEEIWEKEPSDLIEKDKFGRYRIMDSEVGFYDSADNLPEAICLAWLEIF